MDAPPDAKSIAENTWTPHVTIADAQGTTAGTRRYPAMKSAMIHAFTEDPRDIVVVDVPVPEPGPGEVRVRMLLSAVHPADLNYLRGTYYRALERVIWNQSRPADAPGVYFDPGGTIECPAPPYALGLEGVGVVEKCGPGLLARRLLGKRVVVAGSPPRGTWQERVVVNTRRALPLPADVADEQAAMFLANPISAYAMVHDVLRVQRGSRLLVTAAGSALGKDVVRLGRRNGFRTVCVVRSDANTAELLSLGAEAVIDTSRQDLVAEIARLTNGQGVGFALDCVGGELASDVVRCLGLRGHLVVYGTLSDGPMRIPSRDLMMPVAKVSGFYLGNWLSRQSPFRLLRVLRTVRKLSSEGVFRAEVAGVYSLEQAAEAVAAAISPGRTGKILLRIGKAAGAGA